ncbi:MAG: Uncharacterised protein [Crocinitomicaceae bacterium]|nr:MAG: Uncharacterised protein [Crocinitomicaceae bacterium]
MLDGPTIPDNIFPLSSELVTVVLNSSSCDGTKPGEIVSDLTSIAVLGSPFLQKNIKPSSGWLELVNPVAPRF